MSPLSESPVSPLPEGDVSLDEYYLGVSNAFDTAAQSYDRLYQANPIMGWMRRENLAAIREAFDTGSRLLEIGCGTGDEALALASEGYQIVATDISAGMIAAALNKAQAEGISGVTWRSLPAGRLSELACDDRFEPFDGAFASFGALNCEPDLGPIADTLARLVRPNGALVCSVMNRWCAWEIGWSLLHLRPGTGFRRLGPGQQPAGLASPAGDNSVLVRYHTPGTFVRAFAPHFNLKKLSALPVLLPPPYLSHLVDRWPALLDHGQYLERRLCNRFPFHSLGDHFLVVLARTETQSLAGARHR
jgi:ubiquinone/menaquinone biosynthesis C-methylase UbiE